MNKTHRFSLLALFVALLLVPAVTTAQSAQSTQNSATDMLHIEWNIRSHSVAADEPLILAPAEELIVEVQVVDGNGNAYPFELERMELLAQLELGAPTVVAELEAVGGPGSYVLRLQDYEEALLKVAPADYGQQFKPETKCYLHIRDLYLSDPVGNRRRFENRRENYFGWVVGE